MSQISISGQRTFWVQEMTVTIEDLSILPCPTLVTPGATRRTSPLTVTLLDVSVEIVGLNDALESNCEHTNKLIAKIKDGEELTWNEEGFLTAIEEILNRIIDRIGPSVSCGGFPKNSAEWHHFG